MVSKTEKNVHEMRNICLAFMHWTYVYSKGKLLVCDLQGCDTVLTDLAINSVGEFFGSTDLGLLGISRFIRAHICTDACRKMNLIPFNSEERDQAKRDFDKKK